MKKLSILIALLLSVSAAAFAGNLKQAYEEMRGVVKMQDVSQAETDTLLYKLHSTLPVANRRAMISNFEVGSTGVSAAWNGTQQLIGNLKDVKTICKVMTDCNSLEILAEPAGDSVDILAIWQLSYFGRTLVIYGTTTPEKANLMRMGSATVDYFRVSFKPMPEQVFNQLQQLAELQTRIEKDNTSLTREEQQQLLDQCRETLSRTSAAE
ncbi:MAG: hypothetical protein K2L35_02075 [Muribaculaceae bacterium]|nr:hypothetical protein [Muribaculaceae bacterium]